jgi:hypothetical protein
MNRIRFETKMSSFFQGDSMRFAALAALALGLGRSGRRATCRPNRPYPHRELELLRQDRAARLGQAGPGLRACSQGHEQSPIDIRGAHLNKALQPIEFHYIAGPITLVNDGHTIVAHVDPGSYIVANGVRYDLVGFDFHHPGEEAVKGRLSDMEVQLLHRSADGKLAVVDVRLVGIPATPTPRWPLSGSTCRYDRRRQ